MNIWEDVFERESTSIVSKRSAQASYVEGVEGLFLAWRAKDGIRLTTTGHDTHGKRLDYESGSCRWETDGVFNVNLVVGLDGLELRDVIEMGAEHLVFCQCGRMSFHHYRRYRVVTMRGERPRVVMIDEVARLNGMNECNAMQCSQTSLTRTYLTGKA